MVRTRSRTRHSSILADHVLACSIPRVLHVRPPLIISGVIQVPEDHWPQERMVPPHARHSVASRSQTLPHSERPPWHSVSLVQNSLCVAVLIESHSPLAASQADSVSIV